MAESRAGSTTIRAGDRRVTAFGHNIRDIGVTREHETAPAE